jgi:UDP-2,3-diacylglucosamine hydrolase
MLTDLYSLLTSSGSDSTIPDMRTIFLADAHLTSPDNYNFRMILHFLRELEGNTESLYIMGDLFDFWLGFPSQPFRQYDAVLEALLSLKRSGCRLIFFEGNHDFHLGSVFREYLAAEIHPGPAIQTIQGRRLFLCHGDQINRSDYGYRLLRLILHNRLIAAAVSHFPPSLAINIKDRLQRSSRAGYEVKTSRWDYREIIRSFARTICEQGCEGLITGHFHLGYLEELDGKPFTILSLGDWMEQLTYGEMVDGKLSLRAYHRDPTL